MNIIKKTLYAAICIVLLFSGSLIVACENTTDQNNEHHVLKFEFAKDHTGWALSTYFLEMLVKIFNVEILVETGSYHGDTVYNALPSFRQIHTIEISNTLFNEVKDRFKLIDKVNVYHGNSPDILQQILPSLKQKILFWLDASHLTNWHIKYDCNNTDEITPILSELQAIKKSGIQDSIILINDIHCFDAFNCTINSMAENKYPGLKKIRDSILDINENYQIHIYGDFLLAFVKDDSITVSPFIKACTESRFFTENIKTDFQHVIKEEKIISSIENEEKNAFQQLCRIFSDYDPFYNVGYQIRFWNILVLMQENRYSEAQQEILKLIKICPDNSRLTYYLSLILEKVDEKETQLNASLALQNPTIDETDNLKNVDGFILIISLYNEPDEKRLQEYITCLNNNLKHSFIKKIHVIYDTSRDDTHKKLLKYIQSRNIEIDYIKGRPTFGYCFDLVNKQYPNHSIIISNADIYFNGTLSLLKGYNLTNKFLALTRWNVKKDGSIEIFKQSKNGVFRADYSYYSQDTWIFKTPIRKFPKDAIPLGSWHCDSYIAYQAWDAGLNLLNPCLSIQCCHLHLSDVRHYAKEKMPHMIMKPVAWSTLK